MPQSKAHIIAQLKKDLLPLQGLRGAVHSNPVDVGLGSIRYAFANHVFPLAATHEFCCSSAEAVAASTGFISALLASIMSTGVAAWISSEGLPFPPALNNFGLNPDNIIFIRAKRKADIHSAIEEALRCSSLTAVIANTPDQGFVESRRFQLAVEESGVTGFFLRYKPRNLNTACTTRWLVSPLCSYNENELPGIGATRWQIDLIKVRNGKPGSWQVEWKDQKIQLLSASHPLLIYQQRKTG